MTGGTVGKRTLIDPSVLNTNFQNAPQPAGGGMTFGPPVFTGLPKGPSISSSKGPRLFNPTEAVNSALSSFPSQGPKLFNPNSPVNKGGAMTPNAITTPQGPRLFDPKVGINLGGAMTPNAMSGIGYGSSQGPTTFDPTQELNRTIGRDAGAFEMPGRSLVPSKDLKSRSRSL